ncbi:glycosyltransferase family A protein [Microbacterium sp. AK031]|uniref:glycosyltransferase family A protein n=1 Tax=Microbacterium sp. AK031 TaxID=2723076 RepID=UPI0021680344|nr:glycosyltransferase family 2 protein [Microbacterium sp. AK031]MCS3844519.1 glycosyltransferase involved in cell wall biosynthesis [Microbacterium sp. AK031]
MQTDRVVDGRIPGTDAVAPRISVVIPVKNDAAHLERCLTRLALQSRPPDELIVVDNGSSDGSAEVAARFGAAVVRCSEPGIPAASARGYDAANGDIILRLDADCVAPISWIENVVSAFGRRPDIAAVTGAARFIDGPLALRVPLASVYLLGYVLVTVPTLGHLPVFGSNFAMRASTWRSVERLVHRDDPELHDDLDIAFHIGDRRRIGYLRGEAMGISMRPFRSASSFVTRVSRGFRTVFRHWPRDFPPHRWCRVAWHRVSDHRLRGRPS